MSRERECRLEDGWVCLLFHEQRNVLEGVVIVHAETAADNVIAMTGQVVGKAYARAEAFAVVLCLFSNQRCCQRAERGCCLKFLESAAVGNVRATDEVKVFVLAQANVQVQALADLPVILEVNSKLLGVFDDKRGIAHGDLMPLPFNCRRQSGDRNRLWQRQNLAGQLVIVEFQSRVELEEPSHERREDVVNAGFERVLADGLAYVVFELVLALN